MLTAGPSLLEGNAEVSARVLKTQFSFEFRVWDFSSSFLLEFQYEIHCSLDSQMKTLASESLVVTSLKADLLLPITLHSYGTLNNPSFSMNSMNSTTSSR